MKKQLLILITLCISIIGYSQTFTENSTGITYTITSNIPPYTVQATDYNNANINVAIPSTVDYNSTTYTVTSIGFSAFFGNPSMGQISSVSIPNTVTHIGAQAFSGNNLTNIDIPNSVTFIDEYAFQGNQLSSVTFPEGITSIGNGAFRTNNPFLTSVTSLATTPPTITTVSAPDDTFDIGGDRSGIDLFIPSGTMAAYVTDTGALWTGFNSVTELLAVGDTFIVDFITYEVTSITPNTVEVIDYDMAGGTVVDIPATVTYSITNYDVTNIAGGAFQSNNLTHVTIPNSVTNIEISAFHTNQLTSVTIPESVTDIGILAFINNPLNTVVSLSTMPPVITTNSSTDTFSVSGNRSGINLIIPNGTTGAYATDSGALWTGFKMVFEVTSVASNTLKVTDYNSASGTNVNIPATITDASTVYNVTEIDDAAFFSKGLTSVTIPNGVTSIGISSFNTNSLTSVTIPDSVISISAQAFVTNSLTNVVLGNNLETIGLGAFADNDLTSITFPNSVTEIGAIAFAANPLNSVTSLATTPAVITTGTNDTFHITGDRSGIHLQIPAGTMGAYVNDAGALWTGFNPVTEDASLSVSDFELVNDIRVITNQDLIKIIYSNNIRLQNYTIYNISGAIVTTGKENEIPTTYLASGIYILKLDFDEGTVVKKVALK